MLLKTITFNMCHGEGLDGKIDVKRQAELLKKYKPDIVFLQEIDMYTKRVDENNQLFEFSENIGLKYRFMGINIKYKEGFYGDGILSRFPIEYSANYLMPTIKEESEQRGVLSVSISFGTTKIHLFSVHLSTSKKERLLAAEEIVRIIKKIDKNDVIIIGGDFNVGIEKIGKHQYTFEEKECYDEYNILNQVLSQINNNEKTWFSKEGEGCIDTIFYSRNIKLENVQTIKTDLSDHYGVYAEFNI